MGRTELTYKVTQDTFNDARKLEVERVDNPGAMSRFYRNLLASPENCFIDLKKPLHPLSPCSGPSEKLTVCYHCHKNNGQNNQESG
jgi:hypothetical protein